MKTTRDTALALAALALAGLAAGARPAAAQGQALYVAGSGGEFGTLNLATGQFTSINNTTLGETPYALGFSGGALYSLSPTFTLFRLPTTTDVSTIDPNTGAETFDRTLAGPQVYSAAAANGRFYALSFGSPAAFFTINPQTGAETAPSTALPTGYALDGVLGVVGSSVYAAAYNAAVSPYDELFTFNTGTGTLQDVGNTGTAASFSFFTGAATGGSLYGFGAFGDNGIYSFNTSTGAATQIGTYSLPNGDDIDAATFGPAAVPEPSTLVPFALAGLGLLGLTLRARKRSRSA